MYEELVDAITQAVEQKLSQINTNLPATIVSYDAAKNRAVVKVSIPKRLPEDEPLEGPQIIEVPIMWPASGGGKSSLTMPLKKGDGIMLAVQQRSIENWLNGNLQFPDDPRQFDLSDSIGIAGCSYNGTVADPQDVVLKFNEAQIRLKSDNTLVMGNSIGSITITPEGIIILQGISITVNTPSYNGSITMSSDGHITLHGISVTINTPSKTFNLEDHRHLNTQPSVSGISGIPAG